MDSMTTDTAVVVSPLCALRTRPVLVGVRPELLGVSVQAPVFRSVRSIAMSSAAYGLGWSKKNDHAFSTRQGPSASPPV